MKKYIVSGAALLLGTLASPSYCTSITLNFDAEGSGMVCSTTVQPYCITNSGVGAPLPDGTPPEFSTTLGLFGNIPFTEITVSGDPGTNGGAATVFAFTSSGTAFAYSGGTLTNTGTITNGVLSGISGQLITDTAPTVVATVSSNETLAPTYFADGTVAVASSLLAALGIDPSSYQAWLGSDGAPAGGQCNYPEGARDPQTLGPLAGSFAGGCAVGFGNGSTVFDAESQYLEVVISSTATPEPQTSLLLGFALVTVGSLARKRRSQDLICG
jgi:hypothetical protein